MSNTCIESQNTLNHKVFVNMINLNRVKYKLVDKEVNTKMRLGIILMGKI